MIVIIFIITVIVGIVIVTVIVDIIVTSTIDSRSMSMNSRM